MSRPFQTATRLAVLMLVALLLAGCGNPLEDDEPETSAPRQTATSAPEATLAPLAIVTPTEVDPRHIPGTPTPPPEAVTVPETHVVQEGDSLYSIAIKFQLDLAEIVALNGLSDPNDIEVGQELQLPVPESP